MIDLRLSQLRGGFLRLRTQKVEGQWDRDHRCCCTRGEHRSAEALERDASAAKAVRKTPADDARRDHKLLVPRVAGENRPRPETRTVRRRVSDDRDDQSNLML